VAGHLRAALEAVSGGALPSRVLPTPDGEPRTPAEERAFVLALAWAHGDLRLKADHPVEGPLALRVAEVAEELGLGEWVRLWDWASSMVEEAEEPLPPEEAARLILSGRKALGAREPEYLVQVAKALARERRREGLRARVARLIRLSPTAKVTPRDERVVLGRVRAGKPVWVRATPEEHRELVERVVRVLENGRREFISPAWRFSGDEGRPLERLRESLRASARMAAELLEEERRKALEPEGEEWGTESVSLLREEEWRALSLLGIEAEDRLSALRRALELVPGRLAARLGLGKWTPEVEPLPKKLTFRPEAPCPEEGLRWTWGHVEKALRHPKSPLGRLLRREEELLGERVSWAEVARTLLGARERLQGREKPLPPYLEGLVGFLRAIRLRPQREAKRDLALVQTRTEALKERTKALLEELSRRYEERNGVPPEGGALEALRAEAQGRALSELPPEVQEATLRLAEEAALGALPVFLARERLKEAALSLAYEYGLRAVLALRSPRYHPAGLAERLARQDAAYLEELERGVVGGDERTLRKLVRLRALKARYPDASPARLARILGAPLAWVEEALAEMEEPLRLDEPIEGTDGLVLADTVAGEDDPEERAIREAVRRKVREKVEALPEELREVVVLCGMEGLPPEDAAFQLDLPPEEVEARLALAFNLLRYDPELMALVA